jgi:hypothetical protein
MDNTIEYAIEQLALLQAQTQEALEDSSARSLTDKDLIGLHNANMVAIDLRIKLTNYLIKEQEISDTEFFR